MWTTANTLTLVLGIPGCIVAIAGIIVGVMRCFCEDDYKKLKDSVKCRGSPTAADQRPTNTSVPTAGIPEDPVLTNPLLPSQIAGTSEVPVVTDPLLPSPVTGRPIAEDQSSTNTSVPTAGTSEVPVVTDPFPPSPVTGIPILSSNSVGLSDEDKFIREYLLSKQLRVCSTARLFTPATWNTRYHVDIADMFTDLELIKEGSNEENEDAKPTTLKEVLDIIKSTPACKVLIEGEGGIGKSTLLRYVAYKWSTQQSDETFKGKIVFLINLRDVDVGETILDAILKRMKFDDFHVGMDLCKKHILLKKFILKHNDIVLLLDGLDELKCGIESPICIFKNEIMYKCKVLLTSRPGNINDFIKYSSIHMKVNGFNRDNINKYITKFFKNTELGDIKELDLHSHREVYDMCKNPMLLLLVCSIWKQKEHLPTNKADLFKDIFRCILNQFIDKQAPKEQKISVFEKTPKEYVKMMLLLGKCFYESLKKNQLSINKRDLEGPKEMVALALKLGFVYEDTPDLESDFEEIFTTPHKLIVESLVGFYLHKLCQTERLVNERSKDMEMLLKPLADNEWQMIRRSEYFHMARVFTIGFLGAKSAMFLSHWITNDFSTYHSLMTYLKFVKEEHMDTVEMALNDHMNMTHLEIKPHIYGICKSVRTLISYIIPNVEHNQIEHFMQLMRKIGYIYKHKYLNEKVVTDIDHFFRGMSSEVKGRMLAYAMIAAVSGNTQRYLFEGIICRICTADDISYLTAEYQKLNFKYNITSCELRKTTTVSCAIHLLTHAPQLRLLVLSFASFAMNYIIRECSSRGVKLELDDLDISNNNLSNIDSSSFASLFITPKLSALKLNNCTLSGDIVNDMIGECSSRGVKLELSEFHFRNNNLSNIDGSSFASLFITNKLSELDLNNCTLSGDILNDMIRECSSRGVKLELKSLDISINNLSNIDGSSFASLFITRKLRMLNLKNCTLSGDIINDMIIECSNRGVKLALWQLDISNNNVSNIDGSLFASLLIITPKLIMLDLDSCTLFGDIINDMIRECSSRGVKLELKKLDICNNNLSNIDGSLFASLFIITPELSMLNLDNCTLSGDIINDIITECTCREVKLELLELDISNNSLININGSSFASLFITPKLRRLYLNNCTLSGNIINDMIRECSSRGVKLGLLELDISNNNLSNIDGSSFASLFITFKLQIFILNSCTLSGDIINDMIRECICRGVKFELWYLGISNNNLSNIDGSSFASLFITPKLRGLYLNNCTLSGDIINDMIRECSSRGVKFELLELDISNNNLSNIDGSSFASLFITPKLSGLNLNNCTLSGDIINDMIGECTCRGIKLELEDLVISNNNLSNLGGSSFASLFITPNLSMLNLNNCALSGDIINDMIRECTCRGVKLELEDLDIRNNNLTNIDGSSFASLFITPELKLLCMNSCSLSGDTINIISQWCSSREVKLQF